MRMMKGYSMERLYPSETSVMNECFTKFDKLLQLHTPKLRNHMTYKLGVVLFLYLQQWFQTLFLYSSRMDLTLRVIDLLIIRKIEALFSVSLAVIVLLEGGILLDFIFFL